MIEGQNNCTVCFKCSVHYIFNKLDKIIQVFSFSCYSLSLFCICEFENQKANLKIYWEKRLRYTQIYKWKDRYIDIL